MKKGIFHSVFLNLEAGDPLKEYYYFRELGFDKVNCPFEEGYCLTDGTFRLLITPEGFLRTGIVLSGSDMDLMKNEIISRGINITNDLHFPHLTGPSGTTLSLCVLDESVVSPLKGSPISLCGTFFEISVETLDHGATIAFWQKLGLEVIYGDSQGDWVTLADDFIKIGFYKKGTVSHPFRSPAITYFEPDMKDRLKILKDLKVEIAHELGQCKTGPTDAILETPAGHFIFMFTA